MTEEMLKEFNRRVDEYFATATKEEILAGLERSNYEYYVAIPGPAFQCEGEPPTIDPEGEESTMTTQITYSPTEVESMGSEALRIAVATRLGWKKSPIRDSDDTYFWAPPSYQEPPLWNVDMIARRPAHNAEFYLPRWDSDMRAAYELIDKWIAMGGKPSMGYRRDCILPTGESCLGWWVTVRGVRSWDLFGEILPLAICRAWLLATNPEDL